MNPEEYDIEKLREDIIKEFGSQRGVLAFYWKLDGSMMYLEPSDQDYLLIALQMGLDLEKYRRE
ncbi:MAG: hypothetical protein IKP88_04740 [Lachnospiraceae bacterium]|nr:hypothetical protein [Lachnospiraceae bacterium]